MFLQNLRRSVGRWSLFFSSSSLSTRRLSFFALPNIQHNSLLFQNPCRFVDVSLKPTSPLALSHRFLSSSVTQNKDHYEEHPLQHEETEAGETTDDGWEEEDEAEPQVGDGGDGGGVVFQGVPWGERALSIAHEVLLQFGDDIKLYAFKATPRGYVYVRLDKLSNKYGCPSMEELESYSQEYKKKLDEVGALGEIPDDLALEVSTPGAERMLKVPDDLGRFKEMPITVCYEDQDSDSREKTGVFLLDSIEMDSEICVWKLANVKENRDPQEKGRPLSRKQRDWRLNLPFVMHKRVTLYLEY
ncbi:DUF150 domain-containing protein [Citrus sinensis]|uniref:uncharacterized protein LOC102629113 n=1 Tax=Citrus sinensis TaxID=2711 RepID=UPI0003D73FD9|nr:uncharacterized protein LOC102629113 [Citrus sinensis]KAH9708052.1 DUF150 domain-containing protein [Citrus sinensis]